MRKLIEIISKKIKGNDYELDQNIPIFYLISYAVNRFLMLCRGCICALGMNSSGKNLFIGKKVKLKCKRNICLGNNVTIQDNVYIDALSKNGIILGDGCSVGRGTVIRCSGNYRELGEGFRMGENSSLADDCFVGATGGVYIGNDVIGGQCIRFHSSNHNFRDPNKLIRKQGITAKGINIGDNCWIGAGAVFCDGVTIGNGCVIGANSVVTNNFPDNCILVGTPARIIGNTVKIDEDKEIKE